jgi:hypothetical protein
MAQREQGDILKLVNVLKGVWQHSHQEIHMLLRHKALQILSLAVATPDPALSLDRLTASGLLSDVRPPCCSSPFFQPCSGLSTTGSRIPGAIPQVHVSIFVVQRLLGQPDESRFWLPSVEHLEPCTTVCGCLLQLSIFDVSAEKDCICPNRGAKRPWL